MYETNQYSVSVARLLSFGFVAMIIDFSFMQGHPNLELGYSVLMSLRFAMQAFAIIESFKLKIHFCCYKRYFEDLAGSVVFLGLN